MQDYSKIGSVPYQRHGFFIVVPLAKGSKTMPPAASLSAKTKLIPGVRAAVLNSPDGYLNELVLAGVSIDSSLKGQYGWVQIFVRNQLELEAIFRLTRPGLLFCCDRINPLGPNKTFIRCRFLGMNKLALLVAFQTF